MFPYWLQLFSYPSSPTFLFNSDGHLVVHHYLEDFGWRLEVSCQFCGKKPLRLLLQVMSATACSVHNSAPTLLGIVPVTPGQVKSGSGKSLDTYALIDNGAEATLITKTAAKQLGL